MNRPILVIEEDQDITEAIRYNVEKERELSVLSAATGDEGFKLALEAKPQLIILDIGLPGLNGYEVCRMLRREGETRNIPVIILTARASSSDKVIGLELEADGCITKPFEIQELMARVKAAIRSEEAKTEAIPILRP